jgi:phosphohistidine swiveling domain-containing protein
VSTHHESAGEVIDLTDPRATDPAVAGAKAAALAKAAVAGLPVVPGFVLTTGTTGSSPCAREALRGASRLGLTAVAVRSSSTVEDAAESSMAGMFTSVLDVLGDDAFDAAVDEVLASGRAVSGTAPMAVLVQPMVDSAWGGVLFTADPITGRTDHMVVAASADGASSVVDGAASSFTAALSRRGRVVEVRDQGEAPPSSALRALARLGRAAEAAFGGPQDVEWAIDRSGEVRLLQSRPITTLHGDVTGPVFGPGPVAETFPDALAPLEADLWLSPLRDGLRQALALTGGSSARQVRRSPLVVSVGGRAAVDLKVIGADDAKVSFVRRFDPRPPARRLRASWRVGRLSAALPALGRDLATATDAQLAAVPPLEQLANHDLLALLENGQVALRALHGHEVLVGLLAPETVTGATGASMALAALAQAQEEGVPAADLIARAPVALALVPPRVGPEPQLPVVDGSHVVPPEAGDPMATTREVLRLRVRWVQELTARAAWELGRRLEDVGVLDQRCHVRLLELDELRHALERREVPAGLCGRLELEGPALPRSFRLAADGTPMPVSATSSGDGAVGAGGGVGQGPVHLGEDPPAGAVLVVPHLDPRLATVLPRLGGLVAETGSTLSHLAILAREHGVPTVVGLADATTSFATGQLVAVDGAAGTVDVVERLDLTAPEADTADADQADARVLTLGGVR